jgi:hypothetical protein
MDLGYPGLRPGEVGKARSSDASLVIVHRTTEHRSTLCLYGVASLAEYLDTL